MTIQERNQELSRLEELFKTAEFPQTPIHIGGFMTLSNIRTFIDTNITRASANISSLASEPCILRLQQLESHLHNRREQLAQQS